MQTLKLKKPLKPNLAAVFACPSCSYRFGSMLEYTQHWRAGANMCVGTLVTGFETCWQICMVVGIKDCQVVLLAPNGKKTEIRRDLLSVKTAEDLEKLARLSDIEAGKAWGLFACAHDAKARKGTLTSNEAKCLYLASFEKRPAISRRIL